MTILGINHVPGMLAWVHDSAAALVKDGKIIACAEEERFNRIRHSRGFPKYAIDFCLTEAGLSMKDVDIIAIAHNPWAPFTRFRLNLSPENLVRDVANIVLFSYHAKRLSKEAGGAKIVYIDHHLAHAASAYYCSGFPRANVLTMDGSGETESFAYFLGEGGRLRRVWDIPLGGAFSFKKWHSIGMVYTKVTTMLNLGTQAEGKTMGLASYGKPTYDFSSILNIKNHREYRIDRRNLDILYGHLERKDRNGPLTDEHKNLAASLQKALEDSIVNLAREAYGYSGVKHFAFAGGVALNCNTNSKVLEQDFCDDLFIQPSANDGGIALGAALEASARVGDAPAERMTTAYLGPSYSSEAIESLLKNAKVAYTRHNDIEKKTAELVCRGKIVGWFQGRMEIGPRALGNRSILADPTRPTMADEVNINVKHREVWRPFAPSLIEEAAPTYFEGVTKAKESPFMLHTFYVKEKYKGMFPAIEHVDGSSRIQTVRPDQNKRYYTLLKEIENINGHPIVLNTSFNDKDEPIVCTPKDALKCYFATGLDALVLGDFLLVKPEV